MEGGRAEAERRPGGKGVAGGRQAEAFGRSGGIVVLEWHMKLLHGTTRLGSIRVHIDLEPE